MSITEMTNSTFSLEVAYDFTRNGGQIERENIHIAIFEFHLFQTKELASLFIINDHKHNFNEYRMVFKKKFRKLKNDN